MMKIPFQRNGNNDIAGGGGGGGGSSAMTVLSKNNQKNEGFGGVFSSSTENMNASDQKAVDAVLAQELNRLNLQQRETLYEEIHGVDKIIDESPQFLHDKLAAFNNAILSIEEKPAYNLAYGIKSQYVEDPRFRLMFLRADSYDAALAANRCVNYLEEKHRLFGSGPLARRLFLSDLSKDDMVCLKSGALQVLPQRDKSGRAICGNFRNLIPRSYKVVDNMVRALFFFMSTVAEDADSQKRGCVSITYVVGNLVGDYNRELLKKVSRCSDYLPLRQKASHICFNDPLMRTLQPFLLKVMGPKMASRLRLHYGTHTECQYSMLTFGIPVHHLPVTQDGVLKLKGHQKWIHRRETMEKFLNRLGSPSFEAVDLPRRNDVLLGRGKPYQENPGNVYLRSLVEENLDIYQSARLGQKNVLASQILETIHQLPARFVKKRDDGWWVEVDDSEALMKVLKTFRTVRSMQNENSGKPLKVGGGKTGSNKRVKMSTVKSFHPTSEINATLSCFGINCGVGDSDKSPF